MNAHPLAGLLYAQDQLDVVCAERPLTFSEYAHMNEFHGNASILKRYASLPPDPLPFAVEHAIPYDLDTAYEYDLNSGLPAYLAVHERSAEVYRKGGMQDVRPIGFTFVYAMELFHRLHPSAPQYERRGTLVFPDKSTLLMDTDFDREAFAARLAALPEEYQPVVVCIYWKDYARGKHTPFVQAGLPVVSAGHTLDGDFQLRFYDLCRRFKYGCANDIAGSFTLSILAGCHFFFLPTGKLTQHKYGETKEHDIDPTLVKPHKQACMKSAPFPPGDAAEQRRLAAEHAGVRHQRDAAFLSKAWTQARADLSSRLLSHAKFSVKDKGGWQSLLALLPTGIDSDGCAQRVASLFVADTRRVGRLRLKLSVFDREGLPLPAITVLRDHHVETVLEGKTSHILTLDFDPAVPSARITFVSSHAVVLGPDDPRERSFWIREVELREQKRPVPKHLRPSFLQRLMQRLRHAFQ